MASVVRQNLSLEWSINFSVHTNWVVESDSFTVQGSKYKLKFKQEYYRNTLYLQSDRQPNPALEVVIFVDDTHRCLEKSFKRISITRETQEIWCYERNISSNILVTFTIIFSDPSKGKEKPPKCGQNIHFESLSSDFSKLLDDSTSCDIKISCEGKTFNAHRIVLEARSAVFSAMLKSKMVEDETGLVEVEDIRASIFQSFLRYLYSGMLPNLNIDTAKHFYEIGDRYEVEKLKVASSVFLTENLRKGNVCEVLVLADQHSDEDFRKNVISYIVNEKIPQCDGNWPNFCKKHPLLAVEVLNIYVKKYCPA